MRFTSKSSSVCPKQYKRMQGHRQSFTEVKINEVLVGGKSFKA